LGVSHVSLRVSHEQPINQLRLTDEYLIYYQVREEMYERIL